MYVTNIPLIDIAVISNLGKTLTFKSATSSKKNAAKRSRQHAGKKYREYAQRRVCFVNEQVP